MQMRQLGSLKTSAMGLGCMGFSSTYGHAEDANSIAAIHAALDHGITMFDTADMYGSGHNEELLAKAFAGRTQNITIATKFGNKLYPDGSRKVDGTPAYVAASCEGSLRRLGVEAIDLYYLHRVDPDTPIEETVGAMARLVEQGKIRHIGLSEPNGETLRRAHAVHPVSAIQTEYSLWARDPAEEMLPTCRELGVGFVAYSPLGRGFLGGDVRSTADLDENDNRHRFPRFSKGNLAENAKLLAPLEQIAAAIGATSAQVALAWLLQQSDRVVPIPGSRKIARIMENIQACAIEITPEHAAALSKAFPRWAATGDRYPPVQMKYLDG